MATPGVDPAVQVQNLRMMRNATALGTAALVAAWFVAYLRGVGWAVENRLAAVFLLVLLPVTFFALTRMIRRLGPGA